MTPNRKSVQIDDPLNLKLNLSQSSKILSQVDSKEDKEKRFD